MNQITILKCPSCGARFKAGESLIGRTVRCPKCQCKLAISRDSFAESSQEATKQSAEHEQDTNDGGVSPVSIPDSRSIGTLGRFHLNAVLGEGAFGVVYLAHDPILDRQIALKVPTFDTKSKKRTQRFLTEAKSAAQLTHPHIVSVHDAGMEDGKHYIAYAFIKGRTLEEDIKNGVLDFRSAAGLVMKLAEGLDYAHSLRIVHRDVKPANVILDEEGQPFLTDFGLARYESGDERITHDGAVLGTPAYMSPEQARGAGADLTSSSDQYSLGVLLYEILCGKTPFSGGIATVMKSVISDEPRTAKSINLNVPRDLDIICQKAMAKEPLRRYSNCQELADDLRRWLTDEPIHARRSGAAERLWRWRRRNPVIAALSATVCIVVLLGLSLTSWQWMVARNAAAKESEALAALQTKQKALVTARNEAQRDRDLARNESEKAYRYYYDAQLNLVQRDWNECNLGPLLERLDQTRPEHTGGVEMRSFEWYYWMDRCHKDIRTIKGHDISVEALSLSPDGKRLATASHDKTVKLWNPATGEELLTLIGHADRVNRVAFSPDGRRVASASRDSTVKIWNAMTGNEHLTFEGHDAAVTSMAYSKDGQQVVSASGGKTVKIWDANSGNELLTINVSNHPSNIGTVTGVAFSPDGNRFVSCVNLDDEVKVWDARTGQELLSLRHDSAPMTGVAFSPDGQTLASAHYNGTVIVWDAETGKLLLSLQGHRAPIQDLTFSSDGKQLATAGAGMVTVWDPTTGIELHSLQGHTGPATGVAFSPDGKQLYSSGGLGDESVKVWDITVKAAPLTLIPESRSRIRIAYSPDGTRIAFGSLGLVRVCDTATGETLLQYRGHVGRVESVTFSSDGTQIASVRSVEKSVNDPGVVKVWDSSSGEDLFALIEETSMITSVVFRPNEKQLVSANFKGVMKFFDSSTGAELDKFRNISPGRIVAFSPDGKRLASANTPEVIVRDMLSGEVVLRIRTGPQVRSLMFSPDGKLLAAGTGLSTIVWDANSGREMFRLLGHFALAGDAIAFTPDGKRLVTGGTDGTLKMWNVVTGQELLAVKGHNGAINSMAIRPDGQRIVTSGGRSTVKLWDAPVPAR